MTIIRWLLFAWGCICSAVAVHYYIRLVLETDNPLSNELGIGISLGLLYGWPAWLGLPLVVATTWNQLRLPSRLILLAPVMVIALVTIASEAGRLPITLIALAVVVVVAFVLAWRFGRPLLAWLASCAVVPAFVLYAEFVLPRHGGGASMWPIALLFGGIYSAAAGGIGTALGSAMRNYLTRSV